MAYGRSMQGEQISVRLFMPFSYDGGKDSETGEKKERKNRKLVRCHGVELVNQTTVSRKGNNFFLTENITKFSYTSSVVRARDDSMHSYELALLLDFIGALCRHTRIQTDVCSTHSGIYSRALNNVPRKNCNSIFFFL